MKEQGEIVAGLRERFENVVVEDKGDALQQRRHAGARARLPARPRRVHDPGRHRAQGEPGAHARPYDYPGARRRELSEAHADLRSSTERPARLEARHDHPLPATGAEVLMRVAALAVRCSRLPRAAERRRPTVSRTPPKETAESSSRHRADAHETSDARSRSMTGAFDYAADRAHRHGRRVRASSEISRTAAADRGRSLDGADYLALRGRWQDLLGEGARPSRGGDPFDAPLSDSRARAQDPSDVCRHGLRPATRSRTSAWSESGGTEATHYRAHGRPRVSWPRSSLGRSATSSSTAI